MTAEPIWLTPKDVADIIMGIRNDQPQQTVQLTPHGQNGISSALDRARNRWLYGGEQDLTVLATEYAYGLAKAHGLTDGNKRLAFHAMLVF